MQYKILFKKSAEKELKKLPQQVINRIKIKITELQINSTPYGSIQLNEFEIEGLKYEQLYRIRVGDYRIVYAVEKDIITITIVKIAHRKEVYQ
jgi:mRNA interferase RelE/StbE